MDLKDTVSRVAEIIWDVLTDDRYPSLDRLTSDPGRYLADQGAEGVSAEQFEAAVGRLVDRMPSDQLIQMESLRRAAQSLTSGSSGGGSGLGGSSSAQSVLAAQMAAPPQVVRHIVEPQVTHVRESVSSVRNASYQENNSYQQQNVRHTYVEEGDTIVDNRVLTEIHARGDVDFDQVVENRTVIATKGSVAVGDDLEDSTVNTGLNRGIIAGDDVELEDSIVGDENKQVNDSEVGAMSEGGNANNLVGENVNFGSGVLSNVRTGGDAQLAVGDANRLSGDNDVYFDRREVLVVAPSGVSAANGSSAPVAAGGPTPADDGADDAPESSVRPVPLLWLPPAGGKDGSSASPVAGAADPAGLDGAQGASAGGPALLVHPDDPHRGHLDADGHDHLHLGTSPEGHPFNGGLHDGLPDDHDGEFDLDEI